MNLIATSSLLMTAAIGQPREWVPIPDKLPGRSQRANTTSNNSARQVLSQLKTTNDQRPRYAPTSGEYGVLTFSSKADAKLKAISPEVQSGRIKDPMVVKWANDGRSSLEEVQDYVASLKKGEKPDSSAVDKYVADVLSHSIGYAARRLTSYAKASQNPDVDLSVSRLINYPRISFKTLANDLAIAANRPGVDQKAVKEMTQVLGELGIPVDRKGSPSRKPVFIDFRAIEADDEFIKENAEKIQKLGKIAEKAFPVKNNL